MNGLEINPNTNRVKQRTDGREAVRISLCHKNVRNPVALCQFEYGEMLALCLILTLFFPI